MWGIELAVVLVMIGLNAVFAGYEIALASVSRARLDLLVRENRPGAKAALEMKLSIERSFAVIQLAITLCGAIAAGTGGAGAREELAPVLFQAAGIPQFLASALAVILVVIPITAASVVFGELVPKVFALRNGEWVCLKLSPAMLWASRAGGPIVWMFERTVAWIMHWGERRWKSPGEAKGRTEASELLELRAIASLARTSQLIGAREESIIINAAKLSSRPVRESMLRAEHISMLPAECSLGEALVECHLDLHTRFPVTEKPGDPQGIVGYANFKDIVACMRVAGHNPSFRSVVRPILSVEADTTLSHCLETMIRGHAHIALVRDKTGNVVGMITLEDIIEDLVGEIQDEYDRMPTHIQPAGDTWVVGGGALLSKLAESGIHLADDATAAVPRTLDEWFTAHQGRGAAGGDVIRHGGWAVVVRSVRRQRLHEAQLSRLP